MKNKKHDSDLIEVSIYDDFNIDDKCFFSQNGEYWTKGYFAGISKDGKPMRFIYGRTSFTTYKKDSWNFCKKYEE